MKAFLISILLMLSAVVHADSIDSLYDALKHRPQIQERFYIQTDNNCYFVGDTLWYKAFVLRADSLVPTDLSKLLYVELLTPDGYLVSRNRHVIAPDGTTNGQFFLEDSLYSGYYEIRAYTKWQLNFNETIHPHSKIRQHNLFYNKEFREAYFRQQEGLYSRVLPVYEKPLTPGDYGDKRIVPRPKQRIYVDKPELKLTFYPEGGQLVQGLDSRIAFEVTDNDGKGLELTGIFDNNQVISSNKEGRGVFDYSSVKQYGKVSFSYNGKDVSFRLPKVSPSGGIINYDHKNRTVRISSQGVDIGAVSISCRGVLYHFDRLSGNNAIIELSSLSIPTGINEVVVYDTDAQPLASRLFFVNNNDRKRLMECEISAPQVLNDTARVAAYSPVSLDIKGNMPVTFCVSVRDNNVEELSYDDGNIMTDFLLTGELKGFVANPAQYFPRKRENIEEASMKLDLLMMVQGWRRYKRIDKLRYLPERNLTYQGQVLNVPDNAEILDISDIHSDTGGNDIVPSAIGTISCKAHLSAEETAKHVGKSFDEAGLYRCDCRDETHHNHTTGDPIDVKKLTNKQVVVEAELIKDKDVAAVTAPINADGSFKINLPPFYDKAVLMVTAYQNKDSLKKAMTSTKNKKRMDETAFPDYYVKQDMFFPMFTQPYSWYQHNAPEDYDYVEADDVSGALSNNRLAGDHYLSNVTVRKHRKSKLALKWDKPAIKIDAYQLFNEVSDYGLSHGVFDMMKFPMQVSTYLFGYLDEPNEVKVRGMVEVDKEFLKPGESLHHSIFFRNYVPEEGKEYSTPISDYALFEKLHLKRMQNILVYTDYDKRNGVMLESDGVAAVTVVIEPIPNDGKRYTYRDRRYILDGITYPEEFYNPDYSQQKPTAATDYRRTLYWNPNAKPSADGTFHATFYNNSRMTSMKVTASGIDVQGNFYYSE